MSEFISIVVGFKNREIERVKQFITTLKSQTNTNFELIFVDYGSDLELANKVEFYLQEIDFCTYVYHDSRGRSWSRSHALNIGGQLAKGNFLYFTDIDLLFHPNYIQHLNTIKQLDQHIYTRVYYLPEEFTSFDNLYTDNVYYYKQCEISHTSGKGILLCSKEVFCEIGGYDEYYCDWGIEDNDIYIRLVNSGYQENWTDNTIFPVYHAWHPPAENSIEFPDKWLDDSAFYYTINQKNILRNKYGYGKLISITDRKLMQLLANKQIAHTINVHPKGSTSTKTVFYREIWKALNENKEGLIQVNIPKFDFNNLSLTQRVLYKSIKWILQRTRAPYTLAYIEAHLKERFFFPERDIRWFVRKLEKETQHIEDYYINHDSKQVVVYLLGRLKN